MSLPSQTILIHSAAPPKPPEGAPCNGCGVCCLAEPCPLGVVLSGHRHGACKALRWQDASGMYRCGAICEPVDVLKQVLPSPLKAAAPFLAPVLGKLAWRWIAAGVGCDSNLQPGTHPDLTDNSTRQNTHPHD